MYVYLLASKPRGTLYIGVTNDLVRRVWEHKTKAVAGFTLKYEDTISAITREKQMKKWLRAWKVALIETANPYWADLYPGLAGR